jgi:hypothetical protein
VVVPVRGGGAVAEGAGGEGLAGSSAVDSQRLSGLAAVFMFVRAVRS